MKSTHFSNIELLIAVRHPRNYKKNPPQGAELRNINIFREANRLTTELIHLDQELRAAQSADNPESALQVILSDPTKAAQAEILNDYKSRFKKPRLRSFGAERR